MRSLTLSLSLHIKPTRSFSLLGEQRPFQSSFLCFRQASLFLSLTPSILHVFLLYFFLSFHLFLYSDLLSLSLF